MPYLALVECAGGDILKTEIFISLVFGHLLSDFVIQSSKQIENKDDVKTIARHALTVTLISCFMLWKIFPIWIPVVLFLSHFIVDLIKQHLIKKFDKFALAIFLADQFVHFILIYLLAFYIFPRQFEEFFWGTRLGAGYFPSLILLSGFICVTYAVSPLIQLILNPFKQDLRNRTKKKLSGEEESTGFDAGGKFIGILERSFIFILLLINEPSGIGFLVTAKTLFRFGEITKDDNRSEVEYIIIGTLTSFIFAMILSLITFWIVSQYSNLFNFEIIFK